MHGTYLLPIWPLRISNYACSSRLRHSPRLGAAAEPPYASLELLKDTCTSVVEYFRLWLQESAEVGRPRRRVEPWRPEPLLCRRFNVPDPFKGRPSQAATASRFQTDHLALPDTAAALAATAGGPGADPGDTLGPGPGAAAGAAAAPGVPGGGGPGGERAAGAEAGGLAEAGGVGPADAGALADAFLASLGQEARPSLLVLCVCGICCSLKASRASTSRSERSSSCQG